jgi:hypothetical protein
LNIQKGAIDTSTLKPNWSRKLYTVAKVKPGQGSKAVTVRVRDSDGPMMKDVYTLTDIQPVDSTRIGKSVITIQPKQRQSRPKTRSKAAVTLAAPRRSARVRGGGLL